MQAAIGDRITIDSERAGDPPRHGQVLEISEGQHGSSYRIRWDDGRESTIRPFAGTFHVGERTGERRTS